MILDYGNEIANKVFRKYFKTKVMKIKSYILGFCILFIKVSSSYSQEIKKTQVMVLGSLHTDQIENFESAYIQSVLGDLNDQNFDVVAIEQMPAYLLMDLKNRGKEWSIFNNELVELGKNHQKELNISYEEALRKLKQLDALTHVTDNERIEYIDALICTYDDWSALIHYKYVKDKSKLQSYIVDYLEALKQSKNEVTIIGVEVAFKRNLRRVYPIDDLQDELLLRIEYPVFFEEFESNAPELMPLLEASGLYKTLAEMTEEGIETKDFYALYTFLNSSEYKVLDFQTQWEIWFKSNFKSQTDRTRYTLWEMRNLGITANLLRVIAANPGKKVLVIIGAAHVSFLEKYLNQIPDIQVINFK